MAVPVAASHLHSLHRSSADQTHESQRPFSAATSVSGNSNGVTSSNSSNSTRNQGWIWALVSVTALVLISLYRNALSPDSVSQAFTQFLAYLAEHPASTVPVYFVFCVAAIVILCPGVVLQLLAGAAYGVALGLPVAWLATCAGQCAAFQLGRLTFRESLHSYITRKVPQSLAIEKAMVKEGWRLVALLRVAPVVPDSLLNYMLCVTSIRFDVYAATSAVCLLPYVALYVYLGSASKDIWQTVSGGGERSNLQVAVAVLSTLAGVAAIGYIVVVVKRTLKQVLDEEGGGLEDGVAGGSASRGILFEDNAEDFSTDGRRAGSGMLVSEVSPLLGGDDRSRGRRDN